MLSKKMGVIFGLLIIASMVLAACPAPTPEVQTVVQTVVVKETVVQTVKETVETVKEVVQEKVVEVTPTPEGGELVTLSRNLSAEPKTVDPALTSESVGVEISENIFLGLTNLNADGSVEPELATEWNVSDDGLTWTFNMRDDVNWVNYTPSQGIVEVGPVTADDIVYGVRRTCNPETGSDYAYVDYLIKGCQDLNTADTATLSAEEVQALLDGIGVTAVDSYTVQFETNTPAPYFPAIASMWVNYPQPQAAIEAHGETWTEAGNIVTNGPYVVTNWFHADSMDFEKNPFWYGWADGTRGNIDHIQTFFISEASTEFAMYEAGELDTSTVPLPDMDRVKSDPVLSQELVIAPSACTYYYGFVTTKPPVDNVLVRKALSAAIDRKSMVENVLKGGQIPANTFAPSMIFGNAAEDPDIAPWALTEEQGGTGYAAAVEQAKAWLAEAGYPDGEGFPAITIMHNTSEAHAQIAQAVQAMWKEALNIEVNVENQEWRVYLTTIDKDTPIEEAPHVYRLGWCADYADENNWVYEVFNTDAGNNDPRWEETANAPLGPDGMSFNELTLAAQQEQDPATRQTLYKAAEKILSDDGAAIAPIYYYTAVNVAKPYLTRTYNLGMTGEEWYDWSIDEAAKMEATGM
ncbi:MAG: peptide ABC transporter substrate-binding protein [Anaerolineae bacterium]|nr:peptide ABC transporter substrate-binding protein [Anaerolineae bacterium]MCB9131356.1 peptide ABC transporter substrate-binding protein [Anaerolineales bacterium]MCB9141056.1 peptide ABC transporter substrate-binding protein [Anaerolineales bacterium]